MIYDAKCSKCGAGVTLKDMRPAADGKYGIEVEPCKTCLEKADDAGYDRGHAVGRDAERVGE